MKISHMLGSIIGTGIIATACLHEPSTSTERSESDVPYNFYGQRVFRNAFLQAALDIAALPFAFNDVSSESSEAHLSSGPQDIAVRVSATSLTSGNIQVTRVARFATLALTSPANNITAVTSAGIRSVLFGNGNGSAVSHLTPTGCSNSLAGVTITAFVPEDLDPATELLRLHFGVPDQGMWKWCRGVVRVWRDASGLHGQKIDVASNIVSVTLIPVCAAGDAAHVCIGKQAAGSFHAGFASKLAKNANNRTPTVDNVGQTDATFRNGGGYPIADYLEAVRDTSLSDTIVDPIWTQMTGSGASVTEAQLVASGATACSTTAPLGC